jgi:hypothetical protein
MRKASGLRHRVTLYEYVYQMLTENEMIETMCGQYFKTAQHHGDMVELSLTLHELEELTGAVAAESNHARSRSMRNELGGSCDDFEECIGAVKRGEQRGESVSYRQEF